MMDKTDDGGLNEYLRDHVFAPFDSERNGHSRITPDGRLQIAWNDLLQAEIDTDGWVSIQRDSGSVVLDECEMSELVAQWTRFVVARLTWAQGQSAEGEG
jgi:hypothetical protein